MTYISHASLSIALTLIEKGDTLIHVTKTEGVWFLTTVKVAI